MTETIYTFFGIDFYVPLGISRVMVAACLGLCIGAERAFRQKIASLRTFSLMCAGSALFTIMSVEGAGIDGITTHDPTRIAAQILAGVGFLCGGVIFKTHDRVEGVTTAAMIWFTASIGMACGFGHTHLAIWAFVIWFFLNVMTVYLHRWIDKITDEKPLPSTE